MYAQLCRKLCEEVRNFDSSANSSDSTFRRLLLKKCQDEFENRSRANEAFEKKDGPLTPEEEEQRTIAKHKMLGNIKFIGELGKLEMLHETILHRCIQQLLEKKKNYGVGDMAEDLECLCQILRTIGRSVDTDKAKFLMNQYFDRMKQLQLNLDLPSRIRFMLQDTIELRANKWTPRNSITADHGPKTIRQIREEAAKDLGLILTPAIGVSRGPGGVEGGQLMSRASQLTHKSRGGMDDVFSPILLGASTLGTGPGVISTDTFNVYSSNMGRPSRGNMGPTGSLFSSQNSQSYPFQNRPNNQQNQNQFSSQQSQPFSGSTNKDVPPRFMKKFPGNADEISLRPAQNSMMLKPNTPSSLPKSAIPGSSLSNNQENLLPVPPVQPLLPNQKLNLLSNSLIQKEAPILIKQGLDKSKSNKKDQGPSKEEIVKRMESLMTEFLTNQSTEDAVTTIKGMKIPKKVFPELILILMSKTMEKSDEDREAVSKLFTAIKKEGMIISYHVIEGIRLLFNQITDMEAEVPRVKSYVAGFAARAVIDNLVSLAEIAEPLENGAHYPLFLLILQQLHKLQGRGWLGTTFAESKINLLTVLPEIDRSMDRLLGILEDRGLSFLFPLLRIQAELSKQIQADPNPVTFYKWIKENVDMSQYVVPGFINAVVACLIKYVTEETTLMEGSDPAVVPSKGIIDKEKTLLEKFKPVLHAFLHDHIDLQVVALYALQVHCYNHGFPKGMLLRWFISFYEFEVVEEEAFLKWKEDITDDYPGKGKALFQVNQWLTWLEEAEEDASDGEDI